MGERKLSTIYIHGDAQTGRATVTVCRSEEEIRECYDTHVGPYQYHVTSLNELIAARIPPLVLKSACESLGKRVTKLNPKKAWNIMSDQTKEVEKAEAAGKTADAAQQKKDAAAKKKADAEAAKKAKADEAAKKKADAEAAKKAKADEAAKKKADAEAKKKEKEANGGKVVDNRIIRVLKTTAEFRGKRAEAFASLKDGMTVTEFVALAGPIFNDTTAGTHLLGIYLYKELVALEQPAAPAEKAA